ncbi:MAG: hypothetical protein H0T71_01450, partial [Acidobacteria bacterium]|nr:hypothetical protein [Acidobacteriota bacterium]
FWTARAGMLVDRLRASILELDAPASTAAAPLTETLDLVDQLAASERKAREHVRAGEVLLAGEIIFTEARDLLDAMGLQIARARDQIGETAATRQTTLRRQQALLALGAAGVLSFATLLLVIPGRSAGPEIAAAGSHPSVSSGAAADHRLESEPGKPSPAKAMGTEVIGGDGGSAAPALEGASVERHSRSVPALAGPNLADAAAVCTDLARASQSHEIVGLLDRAAKVLDATGMVVWMSSHERGELFPAASTGYDERMLARVGSIPHDAANVTAAAFRHAAPKSSAGHGSSAAALAVPLMTPGGPAGVLTAELRSAGEIDGQRMALAVIFAAQLASLLGSMATPAAAAEPTHSPQQAQA